MSSELINRITIKKDGIYISTHSRNDTSPYTSIKVDFLTEAYKEKGQKELDKIIIDMCFNYCELRGNHKSILPYKVAIEKAINDNRFLEIRNEYRKLDEKGFYIVNRFDEYKNLTKEESKKMYIEIKPKIEKLRDLRNEYVANIVKKERENISSPKELKKYIEEYIGIYEEEHNNENTKEEEEDEEVI